MSIRLTIVYYTTYGTNYTMAQVAAEAAEETGAEVRLLKVRETAPQEVVQGQEAWAAQVEKMKDVAEVTQEAEAAKEAGIQGVPMFIFGGKFAVSGAQAPEYLAEAIQRAAQAAGEAAE